MVKQWAKGGLDWASRLPWFTDRSLWCSMKIDVVSCNRKAVRAFMYHRFRSPLKLLAVGVFLALLPACSSYKPTPPAFHEALNQPYLLGAGDRVRVTVFEQDELTNTYSVDQAGYLSVPLIGAVAARGKTAAQVEREIAAKLADGFIRDPDVSLEIDRYRPVFVMGEVGSAGQYPYVPGMTVQKAVASAGGFTARANQASADVTRDINGEVMTGRVMLSDPLLPGDTIYIRARLF